MRTIALLSLILLAAAAERGDTPLSVVDRRTQTELVRFTSSHALLIGVSRYQRLTPLPGVLEDIPAVNQALSAQGFAVEPVIDPTADQLDRAIKSFIGRWGLDPLGRLVIYFAGHGTVVDDTGYLLAVDTPDDQRDPEFIPRSLAIEDLRTRANQARARHILVACDACFSGSLFRNRETPPANVLAASREGVRLFMTAGSGKETVPDRSVFRLAFVEALSSPAADADRDGYVLGSELFMYLRRRVIDAAEARRERQTPQWKALGLASGEPVGDVVFAVPASALPPLPVSAPATVTGGGTVAQRIAAEKAAREARLTWNAWQANMQMAFQQAQTQAADTDLSVELRRDIWTEFLNAWATDNPHSDQDESLRRQAEEARAKIVAAMAQAITTPVKPEVKPTLTEPTLLAPSQAGAPAWASAKGQDQYGTWADLKVGNVVQRMRLIKAGKFSMGSPVSEDDRESDEAEHSVTLTNDFWLGNSEVTQGMWKQVMGNYPSRVTGVLDFPVEQVSWENCQEFFWKLNILVGNGFTFPTEAQWEYACRAGTTGAYAGILNKVAWYSDNAGGTTNTVMTKSANAWGLFDMHGNVREWCDDAVTGADGASLRVPRGGNWGYDSVSCRAAHRHTYAPSARGNSALGLRLARVPSVPVGK